MDEELSLIGQTKTPLNHTRDVHFLSWAFLFIFLAYGAVQNLESTINTVSFVSVSFIKIVSFLLLLLNFDVMINHILFQSHSANFYFFLGLHSLEKMFRITQIR